MRITEAELKAAAVAPRVTLEDVEAAIRYEHYFTAGDGVQGATDGVNVFYPDNLNRMTFCVLTLQNNFTVQGQSSCASPGNYKVETGRNLAREDAFNKLWALLGFELRTKLSMIEKAGPAMGEILKLGDPTTYIGTKTIRAVAMTRGGYNDYRGWSQPANECSDDNGYLTETVGAEANVPGHAGYVSWSPRDVFEKSYDVGLRLRTLTHTDRMVVERNDLHDKYTRGAAFSKSPSFMNLTNEARMDLLDQLRAMHDYLIVLNRRIERDSK
jgi:hypothetical protein